MGSGTAKGTAKERTPLTTGDDFLHNPKLPQHRGPRGAGHHCRLHGCRLLFNGRALLSAFLAACLAYEYVEAVARTTHLGLLELPSLQRDGGGW